MIPQSKKYFAILVHYGDPEFTRRAVASVLSSTEPPDSITIVNNGLSRQLSLPASVSQIKPRQNLGYAGGINFALGSLTQSGLEAEDIIIFMNNDVVLDREAFANLRAWWDQRPGSSLLGAHFIQEQKSDNAAVFGAGRINLLTGRAKLLPPSALASDNQPLFATPLSLPYLHGAFISINTAALLRLQGLPERGFMYWEDAMLSARASRLKIPLYLNSAIKVYHHDYPVADPKTTYYLVRNGAAFLANETATPWRLYWWVLNWLRLLRHSLPGTSPVVKQALLDNMRGIYGRRKGNHSPVEEVVVPPPFEGGLRGFRRKGKSKNPSSSPCKGEEPPRPVSTNEKSPWL